MQNMRFQKNPLDAVVLKKSCSDGQAAYTACIRNVFQKIFHEILRKCWKCRTWVRSSLRYSKVITLPIYIWNTRCFTFTFLFKCNSGAESDTFAILSYETELNMSTVCFFTAFLFYFTFFRNIFGPI